MRIKRFWTALGPPKVASGRLLTVLGTSERPSKKFGRPPGHPLFAPKSSTRHLELLM
jgi:hypothetical protein